MYVQQGMQINVKFLDQKRTSLKTGRTLFKSFTSGMEFIVFEFILYTFGRQILL